MSDINTGPLPTPPERPRIASPNPQDASDVPTANYICEVPTCEMFNIVCVTYSPDVSIIPRCGGTCGGVFVTEIPLPP